MNEEREATATAVRKSWAAALNTAAATRPLMFHRGEQDFALVSGRFFREVVRRAVPAPEIIAEDDGWTVVLPGHPVAADGEDLDAALRDFIAALRDYATAWDDRLHLAPNHQHAAALVQHTYLSSDADLLDWSRGRTDQTITERV